MFPPDVLPAWVAEMDFALDDATKAASFADREHYFDPDLGNSWTATFAWIRALEALGHVEPGVLADTTSYAVFLKGGTRAHATRFATR